jgi:hypothetical protein
MSNMIAEIFFLDDPKNQLFNIIVEQLDRGGMGSKVQSVVSNLNKKIEELKKEIAEKDYTSATVEPRFIMRMLREYIDDKLNLRKVSEMGTQRKVYAIDDDHVLKVAHTLNGITANNGEASVSATSPLTKYVPKVYYAGPDFYYIISERVEPVYGDREFLEWIRGTDVPDFMKDIHEFNRIISILAGISRRNYSENDSFGILVQELKKPYETPKEAEERVKTIFESDFINQILRIIQDKGFHFSRIINDIVDFNLGFNSEGESVILDYA